MSAEIIVQTTGTLISLVGDIQNALGSGQQPRGSHNRIVTALRSIYFTPSGSLALLAMLAEGNRPSPEVIEVALTHFNDAEFRVERSLADLEDLFDDRAVSLRAAQILREIAYGKRRFRYELQELLNEALTFNYPVDPLDAKAIMMAVKALNSAIESIEAAYNWRVGKL